MNFIRKISSFLISLALILSLQLSPYFYQDSSADSACDKYPQSQIIVNCTLDEETVVTR